MPTPLSSDYVFFTGRGQARTFLVRFCLLLASLELGLVLWLIYLIVPQSRSFLSILGIAPVVMYLWGALGLGLLARDITQQSTTPGVYYEALVALVLKEKPLAQAQSLLEGLPNLIRVRRIAVAFLAAGLCIEVAITVLR